MYCELRGVVGEDQLSRRTEAAAGTGNCGGESGYVQYTMYILFGYAFSGHRCTWCACITALACV